MALVKMKDLLRRAEEKNIGCGAFSVGNMEMVRGAIRAAEELDTPIILQIAEVRLKNSPLHLMGPMMVQAAKEAKVDVAVHLDHGLTFETVDKALELGFTSVMLDASTLPFEENIARVKAVVEKARKYGATVEAELGLVGGSEQMVFNTGAALLDAIVLAVISREKDGTYGYKITQDVRSVLEVSESTLYPVLRRLQKDECLEAYNMEYAGRNRKYYKLTDKGAAQLNLYRSEWEIYSSKITRMFEEGV